MSVLPLDTPLDPPGAQGRVRSSALSAPAWGVMALAAVAAHAIAVILYFAEPEIEEFTAPALEQDEIAVLLTPPGPPPVEEAAPPPPPPPPPDIELPDEPPPPEPEVLAERAQAAPEVSEITNRRVADPDDAPVRRASTTAQAREGSGDPRFTAAQYPIFVAYLREVRLVYVNEVRYPPRAERERLEGRGILRLRVDRRGRVLEWELRQPIGERILDSEIERVARRVGRLPRIPEELPYETLVIDVPITFQLVWVE